MGSLNLANKTSSLRKIILVSLSVFVFGWLLFYFIKNGYLNRLLQLGISFWVITVLWVWLVMLMSSFLTFSIRLKRKVLPENFIDISLFPIAQNLWGYLLPFQGSILFSMLYFKQVHGKGITDSFSVNVFFVLVSMFIAGVLGVIFLISNSFFSTNYVISWVFFLSVICLAAFAFLFNFFQPKTCLGKLPRILSLPINKIFQISS